MAASLHRLALDLGQIDSLLSDSFVQVCLVLVYNDLVDGTINC